MQAINRQSAGDKLRAYFKHPGSLILFLLVMLAALITFAVLVFLIAYILVRGVPYLTPSLFALEYNSDNVSLMPAVVNTLLMILMSLLLAVPFGIFAAIYLVEYAKKGNKLVSVVRVTAETLSGIPSIVYGLFGMLFFVTTLKWSYSMLSGAFTLAIMILPLIMRTTEEALLAVPDSYPGRKLRTGSRKSCAPCSASCFPARYRESWRASSWASAVSWARRRALMYTSGTVAKYAGPMDSGRTLALHMYVLTSEALHVNEASATAVVLLVVVIGINALSSFVAKKLRQKTGA